MPKNARKTPRQKKAKPIKPTVLANNADIRPLKRKKARAPNARNTAFVRPHHVRGVCAVTDPFCPASKSSKWPDGTSGNTLTEQFRGNTTLPVDANGNQFACFSATAPFGLITSTVVGSTATTSATYSTYKANSMLATYGGQYRIVSFGIIVRCVAAATTASGTITFGSGPAAAVSTAYTTGQELYSEVLVKAIQPGLEVAWISTPAGTSARSFEAQSTATNVASDWNSLWLEITGAPASSVPLNIEWFMNIEFLPLMTARSLTAIAKSNPPKSSVAETATSKVHSTLGSFVEGGVAVVEQAVAKHATNALATFADNPFDSLASLLAFI